MYNILIETEDLSKIYQIGSNEVKALEKVRVKIQKGEILGIYGPSGSGKSTLLHILGTLDKVSSGQVLINNKNIGNLSSGETAELRHQIGFVFQDYNLIPRLTALENVILGLSIPEISSRTERKKLAAQTLEYVGLGERLDHKPGELSGGEQQRVAIARALAKKPSILFMDEPTGNVDSNTKNLLMKLILKINQESDLTIVIASHDVDIARYCHRTIELLDGKVIKAKKLQSIKRGGCN